MCCAWEMPISSIFAMLCLAASCTALADGCVSLPCIPVCLPALLRVQFLAAAAIIQSDDTTAPIATASAAVDIEVTGCSGSQPEAASLSLVRSFKTRLMQWSVKKQTAVPIDDAFKYVPGGDNTVNVTVLFSRELKAGQQVSVAGAGKVNTDSQKPVFGRSRVSVSIIRGDSISWPALLLLLHLLLH